MSWIGPFPYGTDGGEDTDPSQDGSDIIQGIAKGVQYTVSLNAAKRVVPISYITDFTRVGSALGSGTIPTSGGNMATITITKNNVIIDSATGTINFNTAATGSFSPVDRAGGGIVDMELNYLAAGGNNGSLQQPARADHSHPTQLGLMGRSTRDEVTNGQFSVSSTSGVTVLSAGFTMPNDGNSYLLVATAWGVVFNNPGNIWVGVAFNNGSTVYFSGNVQTNASGRLAMGWIVVTGSGQAVSAQTTAKVDTGTGLFGSGLILLEGFPAPMV